MEELSRLDPDESMPLGNRFDTHAGRRLGDPHVRIVTFDVVKTQSLVLVLSESEREALLRVLYVVKDNFWLDDLEEELLERLLEFCPSAIEQVLPTAL